MEDEKEALPAPAKCLELLRSCSKKQSMRRAARWTISSQYISEYSIVFEWKRSTREEKVL